MLVNGSGCYFIYNFFSGGYIIIHWNNKVFKEILNKKIHWPKRDTHPKDTPDCGFDGSLCKTESKERKKKKSYFY